MSHRVRCYHKVGVKFWAKPMGVLNGERQHVQVVVHTSDGSRCDTRSLLSDQGVMSVLDIANAEHVPTRRN